MKMRDEAFDVLDRASRTLQAADQALHEPRNWRRIARDKELLEKFREFTRLRVDTEKLIEQIRQRMIGPKEV